MSGPFDLPFAVMAVQEAMKHLGSKYIYGADGPNNFDCSGLMQYAYSKIGVKIPRTSEEQFNWSSARKISQKDLQPGDLVFYAGSGSASQPGHVGMYIGNNKIIQAPHTGDVVKQSGINDPGTPVGFRRMPGVQVGGSGVIDDIGAAGTGIINDVTGAAGDLFNFPSQIIGFFGKATTDLTSVSQSFSLFFQPSTYVRIGAGLFGAILLIAAMFFLIREAGSHHG